MTGLIVFTVLALCALLVLIVMDLVRRGKESKQEAAEPQPVPVAQADEEAQPVAAASAQAVEEEAQPEQENNDESTDSVSFAVAASNSTLDEKFHDLTPQYKAYYNQIARHASNKEGAKCIKNNSYEEYKLYHARLVRLQIKSGIVVCQFILVNSDFQSYISDNKLKVKQAPVVLKVTDDETLQAAISSIDIAYDAAMKERERKVQLRREKVRQAREAKKNAAADNGNE